MFDLDLDSDQRATLAALTGDRSLRRLGGGCPECFDRRLAELVVRFPAPACLYALEQAKARVTPKQPGERRPPGSLPQYMRRAAEHWIDSHPTA